MNLGSTINALSEPVTLLRASAGTWANGRHTPGAYTSVARKMTCAPAGPKTVLILPEALRAEKSIVVFCAEDLRGADAGGLGSDRVVYHGETFELHKIEDWSGTGGYWSAIGVRVRT